MIVAVILGIALVQDAGVSAQTWSGAGKQLNVTIPRLELPAVVDGTLDEAVWSRAARLRDFSQYQPVDGRAAVEPTEVMVWYAPDAIWFGIRAHEVHGDVIRATRANRDNISSEDYVQILLDTFNDRRNAFVFGVNPLGIQQDGTRADGFGGGAGGRSATGSGMREMNPLDGNVDLNPDFTFDSRGRLIDGGYEVEIRIPFKTLRYQDLEVQRWGLHVLRRVQHSGAQDSWAPVVRASASFFSQSGSLEGLRELERGLVLEATPTVTARANGERRPTNWEYRSASDVGADLRWGIRQNLTLNATVNPDFSQVEADVGQVTLNERFALFYPEKRPFFLDGLELFDTPNRLIYTRQIVAPDVGIKFAGKVANTNVALLAAADDKAASIDGIGRPLFGVARIRRDIGAQSTMGTVLTTREDGSNYSRLAGADVRIVHDRLYYAQFQAVGSWTEAGGLSRDGGFFEGVWDRTGRSWGFHYSAQATAPDFVAAAGFVDRTGVAEASASNRFTYYGGPGAFVETASAFVSFTRIAEYDRPRGGSIEGSESIRPSATLRGGWRLNASLARNFFSYDPDAYASYSIDAGADTTAFVAPSNESGLYSGSIGFTTPTFRAFTGSVTLNRGATPLFREASRGRSTRVDASLDLRPTSALRASVQMANLALDRDRDGSRYSREAIPRVKLEYQATRSIFVRAVAQYTARSREPLRDASGRSILVSDALDPGESTNELLADWLFSYRPTPGTLFYIGYGTTMGEPDRFQFGDLTRSRDGFFAKMSYSFRM